MLWCALIGVLGMSACSPAATEPAVDSGPSSASDHSIVVWTDAEHAPVVEEAAEQFTADTGTQVRTLVKQPGSLEEEFATPAPDQQPPDLVLTGHGRIGALVRDGLIAPVPLAGRAAEFVAVSVAAFSYDDQHYGVPFAFENLALVRNTTLAPTAPATWSDALAAAATSKATLPILVGGQDTAKSTVCTLYPFQASFGAEFHARTPDGSVDLRKLGMGGEPGRAFAEWLDAQSAAGILRKAITSEVAINEFAAGNSPFLITGPWHLERIRDSGIDYAIDPIPQAGPQPATGFVNVQGFVMSAASTQPDAVRTFLLDYLAGADTQKALAKASGRPAAQLAALEATTTDPDLAAFAELGRLGIATPNHPAMPTLWADWANAENEIIDRRTADPAGTWQAMVTALQGRIG